MNKIMLNKLLQSADCEAVIEDLHIFLNWVIVKTKFYTMSTMLQGMPGLVDPQGMNTYAGNVIGKNALTIAEEYLLSKETLKRAIGMASLKGIIPQPVNSISGNAIDHFKEFALSHRTCFIGHFNEARIWREKGYPVSIVELYPRPGDIHWNNSHEALKNVELVMMTGLTLVNDTFDEVIERTPNALHRVIMGPTVPLSPVLFDFGITMAGGTIIKDPQKTIRYCQMGGGSIACAPDDALEKINICK